jgi:hypothetical protein
MSLSPHLSNTTMFITVLLYMLNLYKFNLDMVSLGIDTIKEY